MLAAVQEPPYTLAPFRGPQTTIDTMRAQIKGPRGERSMLVHEVTKEVVRWLQPKDYLSEILAVRNFVTEKVRYKNDPLTTELVQDPHKLIEDVLKYGRAVGDCDDLAALIVTMCRQLGREADLVTVGFGKPNHYSHVFGRALEPKSARYIVCDPVAGTDEASMLRRVKTYRIWKID